MYAIPNFLSIAMPLIEANQSAIVINQSGIATNLSEIATNAAAILTNAAAIASKRYVNRDTIGQYDFINTDFTADDQWRDLNLSSIVGEAKRLVLLRVSIEQANAEKYVKFRNKGKTAIYDETRLYTQVGAKKHDEDILMETDTSGKIEIVVQTGTWSVINIIVKGWFEL